MTSASTLPAGRAVLPRYLVVAALTRLCDEGARVGFVLLAVARTGSAAFGGQLVAALLVPQVLAAPLVGAVADRTRQRRAFTLLCLAVFAFAVGLCAGLAGRAPTLLVLAVAAVGGCFAPMAFGGLTALLRDLVSEPRLARAYSLDVMTYNVAGISGPAMTGILAGVIGVEAAVYCLAGVIGVEAAVYCLAAGALAAAGLAASLPITTRVRPEKATWPSPFAGFTALVRERPLRAVTVSTTMSQLGFGAMPVVVVLLAGSAHNGVAGGLLSAFALGGLFGSLAYARYPVGTSAPERTVLIAMIGMGLPLLLVAAIPDTATRLGVFAVAGFFSGPLTAAMLTSRDRWAPAGTHSQVFTVAAGLRITAAAAGAALAGSAAGVGPTGLVVAVAAAQLLGATGGWVLLRQGHHSVSRRAPGRGGRPTRC
jgi:MFS family permease